MGWLYMHRDSMGGHATAKAYLDAQFTYAREQPDGGSRGFNVVASACVGNRVYYAAAQRMENGIGHEIVAIVCLVRWNPRDREGLVFGYKDMDETCGPNEAACPPRILALLSPTDNAYALAWRERCRVRAERAKRRLEEGMRIRLARPVTFTDGYSGDEFVVERLGRRLALRPPGGGGRYRIRGIATLDWTVVHETRVHGTVFA
ncbi:hypothetical protein D9601_17030 [Sphingomonas sp. MA1305]|jgi:hypothetical protein|uniref:DUF6927 domain-containing protein n=1 Tax=Sphingomonas sp. MA1305 TaxID=2479204 RepID=UPI0018E03086|nr:hypothetical protein [Sphingomonas sp. MA1305]MBI0477054.1 hypothetical protein [Sphingomonas sp. MA1305]